MLVSRLSSLLQPFHACSACQTHCIMAIFQTLMLETVSTAGMLLPLT